MRTLRRRTITAACIALIGALSYTWSTLVPDATAIPAFARKYNFACNVCHVPGFPKLNDFGNLFRDQGYQLGLDMDIPESPTITMGFWPVSFRTTVGYQLASVRTDGSGITTGGFGFTGLDILSYGTLYRDIALGVVFTPGLKSAGFGTGPSESELESAWVRLMRLEKFVGIKPEPTTYLLNVRVGKFELDLPFSEKRSPTLNTNMVMYHYLPGTPYTATISGTSTSSYLNPNDFMLGDNQPGAELAGITKTAATNGYFRYSLAALSTNSFGGHLAGCPAGTTCGTGGRHVNFYGHATQSFGGYGIVTGQRIGVFGMYGQAPTLVNPTCPTCQAVAGNSQPFNRVGVDVSLTLGNEWNLFGAVMHGDDSKNLFLSQGIANAQNASWYGGFVELDWYPTALPFTRMPGWLLIYRYDLIRNDRQGDPTFAKVYNNVDSHTFMARYYIHQSSRTDIAAHAEYNTYRTRGVGTGGGDLLGQTMLFGLDFAF
ncbi:hypothetical protein [Nitrospira sp. Nam74]